MQNIVHKGKEYSMNLSEQMVKYPYFTYNFLEHVKLFLTFIYNHIIKVFNTFGFPV